MGTLVALAPLIAQYGLPLVADLIDLFKSKPEPTGDDFRALHAKYGSKSYAQYLAEAQANAQLPTVPPTP